MYEANLRAGTHKTKTRGEVKGVNNKMWKQKHHFAKAARMAHVLLSNAEVALESS